ncbi:uncharacterized protein A4U43_C03F28920 [Asparagus officinalis]|uniref:Uncharacterized protein n=1 Tax=Asparagus officinalis TaxID=4686 RepID=A0A5P1FIU9_ASPOF|nr:uncharacterized protein A4U43_C03F28920 [Asparagus officinalis]
MHGRRVGWLRVNGGDDEKGGRGWLGAEALEPQAAWLFEERVESNVGETAGEGTVVGAWRDGAEFEKEGDGLSQMVGILTPLMFDKYFVLF